MRLPERPFKLKMRFVRLAVFALLAFAGAAWAKQSASISVAAYIQSLDDLITATGELADHPEQIDRVVATIPNVWRLESGGQTFEIPTEALRKALLAEKDHPGSGDLKRIREHLELLRSEAVAFIGQPADTAAARTRLEEILSRADFNRVHGQTWQDRLRQWILEFLAWLFGSAFRSSTIPTIGAILVYALVAAAFVALVVWGYRAIRGAATHEEALARPQPVSAKEWSVWLAEARAEAERGNWANAIHLAYWAGISLLESQGAWRPDQARTPREYLRLLPSSSEHGPTLTALTRGFEVVWYGGQAADASSFAETMAHLERLGCR